MVRIAIDAMGGDHAPACVVEGAIQALQEEQGKDLSIVLVGRKKVIEAELNRLGSPDLPIQIHHAEDVVEMDESPSKAFKSKPESSMNLTIKLQAAGTVDSSLSAGNTGALLVASTLIQGRLEGLQRPALLVVVPSFSGPCVFLDVGANADCKPQHLLQFAAMGSAYAEYVLDLPNPTVGLLSLGEESTKGNELTLATYPLLEQSSLNFSGNVEGNAILAGKVNVVVCDGFVGNIVLKVIETIPMLLKKSSKEASSLDYAQYGGAPFLGVNGNCIKAHGSSNSRAIKNAIFAAAKTVRHNVNQHIRDFIQKNT